jgi:hypothetical protein
MDNTDGSHSGASGLTHERHITDEMKAFLSEIVIQLRTMQQANDAMGAKLSIIDRDLAALKAFNESRQNR